MTDFDALITERDKLKKTNKNLSESNRMQQVQIDENNATIKQLKKDIASYEGESAGLVADIVSLKGELGKLKAEKIAFEKEIAAKKSDLKGVRELVSEDIRKEEARLKDEIILIRESIVSAKKDISVLEKQKEDLVKFFKKLNADINE